MSIQSIVATILERELAARGVHSLRHSDCMEIVENLIVRLNADSDEAGHAFQFEAGRVFRSEAGHPWRRSHGS
ncbi:hypothetical protein, partial [Bradyrhizobium sp. 151]|uniref:hypothetical protein n=1 Tax=Bradyrhizobium sp. 151 TaxID=2782626 RepID=UPI001FF92469